MRSAIILVISFFAFGTAPLFVSAITSQNYELDAENNVTSVHHNLTSSNYEIEGALESIAGKTSATEYILESGSAFGWYCGDGFIDPLEDCDTGTYGTITGGNSCATYGYTSGSFSCSASCRSVTASCSNVVSSGHGSSDSPEETAGDSSPSTDLVLYDLPSAIDGMISAPFTYRDTRTLSGSRADNTETIRINGNDASVRYYDDDTWVAILRLSIGVNIFTVERVDAEGVVLASVDVTFPRRLRGDANDDGAVNDADLSLLSRRWQTGDLEADFNSDGIVDDYDLSILVARWSF